jgi:FkbM family methyltransferase
LNLGASKYTKIVNMEVPFFDIGLRNYFQASITDNNTDIVSMVTQIDSIQFPNKIKLVKIDTEGHELDVISGMEKLLLQDYPIIIVEASSYSIVEHLEEYGYSMERLDDSPNYIFRHK